MSHQSLKITTIVSIQLRTTIQSLLHMSAHFFVNVDPLRRPVETHPAAHGEDGDAARPPDGRDLARHGGPQVVQVILHPLERNHFLPRSLSFDLSPQISFQLSSVVRLRPSTFTYSAIVYMRTTHRFTATMIRRLFLFRPRPFSALILRWQK